MSTDIGTWRTETVGGHPCEVYDPPERNPQGYVILYLHDVHLETLRDKPAFCEQLARHRLTVVAPVTQGSWWTDRLCSEFDEHVTAQQHVLEQVLPLIKNRWNCQPPRLALLGTGMGAQGALRLAYRFPDTFPVVAAISPAIDYQICFAEGDEVLVGMYPDAEAVRQDTALLHVHPLNWPRHQFFCCDPRDARWFDSADRLRMKLSSLGVPFQCDLETSCGGHDPEYASVMAEKAVGFLVERLEQELKKGDR